MTDFFRFPHTPHLAWLGQGTPRDDKVLAPAEARALLTDAVVVVEEKLDGANLGLSLALGRITIKDRGCPMDEMTVEQVDRIPTHPGEILREEVLPALDISVAEFARGLRVSRQTVHGILSERKGITPEMALRIGKYLGNGPGTWLRMQQAYDLIVAERRLAEELATIHKREQAA